MPDNALQDLLAGKTVHTPPTMLWKHFHLDSAWPLAHATAEFYKDHHLAAAKIMPDVPLLFPDLSVTSATQLSALAGVTALGRADEYVETIRHTRALLDDSDVLLATIFSPLALIGMWGGPELISEFTSTNRIRAHALLADLAVGVADLVENCAKAGADGVYYSCWGQDVVDERTYAEYGVPYDLAGLRGGRSMKFRLLHLHGAGGTDPARFVDYPVNSIGWSQLDSKVPMHTLDGKIPMGGMSERPSGNPAEIRETTRQELGHIKNAVGAQFIACPGCSLPDDVSDATIEALRAAVTDVYATAA